ncbi:hypothetical protein NDU88_006132 [Pleurodeles waltl]|uniref:Secreted protein n=1 Tax=Pleurodeles waltl TaxID=8319 RepID=A0AAV7VNR5_PLEWA|nr:hypothetical protein NDU88_006132 [Pleurodeles waltl]
MLRPRMRLLSRPMPAGMGGFAGTQWGVPCLLAFPLLHLDFGTLQNQACESACRLSHRLQRTMPAALYLISLRTRLQTWPQRLDNTDTNLLQTGQYKHGSY